MRWLTMIIALGSARVLTPGGEVPHATVILEGVASPAASTPTRRLWMRV
jgi:hypothetical protein